MAAKMGKSMIFLILASLTQPFTRSEQADLLELNHHYDLQGCHVYDQLIVWRQNPATFRYEVASWTLCDTQGKYPTRLPSGVYRVNWLDSGKPREVVSRQFRESWTQTDPERDDQRRVHPDDRIRLIEK
jgi:hypothetical protein